MASPSTRWLSFHGSLYAKPRILSPSLPLAYYPLQNPNNKGGEGQAIDMQSGYFTGRAASVGNRRVHPQFLCFSGGEASGR
ncbi:hypothetical protein F2Q69_00048793 [Brassica cretica]|uniref:Uncharacterized protein n=1 Tax=Brassica cretica TaxID=69181 RepID=A0A8S9Q6C3_BRACR|nr:hypothetical protein F2Q69_00048793 [Brassica cretica]